MARLVIKRDVVWPLVLATFLGIVVWGLASAWVLMLLFGMFAGYLGIPGLALGYWASYGIYLMARFVFAAKADVDD